LGIKEVQRNIQIPHRRQNTCIPENINNDTLRSIDDDELSINNYNLVCKDRTRGGDGVALYVKNTFSFTNGADLVTESLEMVCIEIHFSHSRSLLVRTWYHPPNSTIDLLDSYERFIEKCDYEQKAAYSYGRHKCRLWEVHPENHTRKLQFISDLYQLKQANPNEPTRITNTSKSTSDLIFTTEPETIIKSNVIHIGMSDHSLVFAIRKFTDPKAKPIIKKDKILNLLMNLSLFPT